MIRSVSLAPGPEPSASLDAMALRPWVLALCAIRFDLEQGQVVEECYPAGAISSEEEVDVAFSSFPDSMSQSHNRTSIYDCMFFFRIRRRGNTSANPQPINTRRPTGASVSDITEKSPGEGTRSSTFSSADVGMVVSLKDRSTTSPSVRDRRPEELDMRHRRLSTESSISFNAGMDGLFDEQTGGRWSLPGILSNMISPSVRRRNSDGIVQSDVGLRSSRSSDLTFRSVVNEDGTARNRGGPGSGGPRYLYGFVFNRQRKDERLRRGGEQKSVVILSERPYSNVFRSLLQILGPLYFDIGVQGLEQVAAYVSRWPNPVHGALMELPVGNVSLRAHLPPAHTLPPGCGTPMDDFTSAMAPVTPLNPSIPQGVFHEADIFGIFRGVLMQLWELWELVLIGEPLLVVAPTPSQCCEAVAALVGLVAPLPCSIDFRPYFTIHDPDFGLLNTLREGEGVPPMILGVTNLFFLKALRSLPHVVSVGSSLTTSNRLRLVSRSTPDNGSNSQGRLQLQLQLSPFKKFSPTNLLRVARVKRDGPLCLMTEHREALWTSYMPATKPDTSVLNRLVDAGLSPRIEESMSLVNNEILHRHFLELTTNFLAPFGPFLRATTPQEGTSPFVDPPPLTPFDAHEFVEGLAARGPGKFLAKRLRANWLDLYRRFLKGPNFMPWFQRRRAVAEHEQHRIWRQARVKADIRSFILKMSEVEVIDSFNVVERHLLAEVQSLQRAGLGTSDSPISQKLRGDLRTIYNALPKDMQQLLLFNPQKAALLQGSREFAKLPGRLSVLMSKGMESSPSSANTEQGKLSQVQELPHDSLDLERT